MTIRARADALLTQTDLLQTLSAYGCAHLVGSYVTDLMVYPDLDFYMDSASLTPDTYHALFRDLHLYGLDKGKQHYHSQDIYDAVFLEGLHTAEEFMNKHPLP